MLNNLSMVTQLVGDRIWLWSAYNHYVVPQTLRPFLEQL